MEKEKNHPSKPPIVGNNDGPENVINTLVAVPVLYRLNGRCGT